MVNESDLYNKDELNAPEWLNDGFFADLLKKKENAAVIKITKRVIQPGTTKSDHYGSVMFRAKINYSVSSGASEAVHKFQSMIIKTAPTAEGEKKELLKDVPLFDTEIRMYTETLPKIESVLRKYNDSTKLCANILYHSLGERTCIIFEDLAEEGYTTISGRHPTIEEVNLSLMKVAKLHAVSYMLGKQNDPLITTLNQGSFSLSAIDNFVMVKNAVRDFKEILQNHEDLKPYLAHFEPLEHDLLNKCKASFNAFKNGKRDGILVLNHGDFHMKNLMIKQTDNGLKDVMLLDYQISFYGSAAIDILYAYIMLFSSDMRYDCRDELISHYVMHFQATLQLIDFQGDIPTVADFQQEFNKHKHWELFLFISFLVFNHVFADKTGDLAKVVENESYRKSLMESKTMLKEFRTLLPRYLHQGYFAN